MLLLLFLFYGTWIALGLAGLVFWCARLPVLWLPSLERSICELPLAADFHHELTSLGMSQSSAHELRFFLLFVSPWMFTIDPKWYRRTEGVLLSILLYMHSGKRGERNGREFASKLFWKRLLNENGVPTPCLLGYAESDGGFISSDRLEGLLADRCVNDQSEEAHGEEEEGLGGNHSPVMAILKPMRGCRGEGVRRVDARECRHTKGEFIVEEEVALPLARHTRVVTLNRDTDPVLAAYRITDHASDLVSNKGGVERIRPPRVSDLLSRVHHTDARLEHVPVVCWDVLVSKCDDAENGFEEYVIEGNWPGGGLAWKIAADDILDEYRRFCEVWIKRCGRNAGAKTRATKRA